MQALRFPDLRPGAAGIGLPAFRRPGEARRELSAHREQELDVEAGQRLDTAQRLGDLR